MDLWVTLEDKLRKSISKVGLEHISDLIVAIAKPAILIELLESDDSKIPIGESKIGGNPDLPLDYKYPYWKNRPLGFIGQINLAEASKFDIENLLPKEGVLSFFYDLHEMPWGYDPKNLGFSRVEYFSPTVQLTRRKIADDISLECSSIIFSPSLTVPSTCSQDYEVLQNQHKFTDDEEERYWNLQEELQITYSQTGSQAPHRLLGYSANVQDDMQIEAELVTNGLYCGDPSGYNDPKAETLKPLAKEWQLLLQLDSYYLGNYSGYMYYWIRRSDLINSRFENHWMTMQCD